MKLQMGKCGPRCPLTQSGVQGCSALLKPRATARAGARSFVVGHAHHTSGVVQNHAVKVKTPLHLEEMMLAEITREGNVDPALISSSHHSKEARFRPKAVYRNLSPAMLYEMALKYEPGTCVTSTGALATTSGAKMGRSPKDKRVVRDASTEGEIWRGPGSPNHESTDNAFLSSRETAIEHLNHADRVYVVDAYANWDPKHRRKIRVITTRAYHALFMHNMLIRPSPEELMDFGEPDFVIYNAGAFPAKHHHSPSGTSIDLALERREMVILGTQYAGEMKKGVFSVMNYFMPKQGVLSLHSGCNIGQGGDVTLFFGLSGTGKTTLSTDPRRPLIGDDEHCWGESGVFNIEGGCYAKCINLKAKSEPEIWKAIRFGSILENVVMDPVTRQVDFESAALTENTRASYPIDFIDNAHLPCVGPHPRNVVLLCCDAFGVLPPVSQLTKEQAMYHFISGYTTKIPGTEVGVVEPQPTFSACYGSAFLMWHPYKYAAMLADKMTRHSTNVWLVNTGWSGGSYGVGKRMPIKDTRAIIDAIHSGELQNAPTVTSKYFGLQVPTRCSGVAEEVLQPENTWADKAKFDAILAKLAKSFNDNFGKYQDGAQYVGEQLAASVLTGGPML